MKPIRLTSVLIALLLAVVAPAADRPADPAPSPAPAPAQELTHWLTLKSGIRHNSKCRYFHHSQGRPCTKDEGRACKICGG